MVRLGISVEGTTEERFVKMLLVPYLSEEGIYATPISIGGDVKIDRIKHELQQISYSFDYVSTFYDFYGFLRVRPKGKLKRVWNPRSVSRSNQS